MKWIGEREISRTRSSEEGELLEIGIARKGV